MPVTFNVAGTPNTGTTTLSLTTPAGALANDFLIAYVIDAATSGSSAAPTGWTRRAGTANSNGRQQLFTATVGQGGVTANQSTSFTGLTGNSTGVITAYTGADPNTPYDASNVRNNASGTTGAAGMTASLPNDLIIACFCSYANGATWSAQTATGLTFTERIDFANAALQSIDVCDARKLGTGTTGATSATMSANAVNGGAVLGIRVALTVGSRVDTVTSGDSESTLPLQASVSTVEGVIASDSETAQGTLLNSITDHVLTGDNESASISHAVPITPPTTQLIAGWGRGDRFWQREQREERNVIFRVRGLHAKLTLGKIRAWGGRGLGAFVFPARLRIYTHRVRIDASSQPSLTSLQTQMLLGHARIDISVKTFSMGNILRSDVSRPKILAIRNFSDEELINFLADLP